MHSRRQDRETQNENHKDRWGESEFGFPHRIVGLPGDAEPLQSTAPYDVLRRDVGEIAPLRHIRRHFGEVAAMTRQDDRYVEDQERYDAGGKS